MILRKGTGIYSPCSETFLSQKSFQVLRGPKHSREALLKRKIYLATVLLPLARFLPLLCFLVIVSAQLSSSHVCLCSPATCSGSLPITAPTPLLHGPPVLFLIKELSPWSYTNAIHLAPWAVSCSL